MVLTTNLTRGTRFERFMRGKKKWTGSINRKIGLLGEVLHALLEELEEDWEITKAEEQRKDIEDLAVFVITELCGVMRGEKVPLLSLKGVLYFW